MTQMTQIGTIKTAENRKSVIGPRLVLGATLTFFSLATIGRAVETAPGEVSRAHWKLQELTLSAQRQAERVSTRAIRYYRDVQLVYRIAQRVRSLDQEQRLMGTDSGVDVQGSEDRPQQDEPTLRPNLLMARERVPLQTGNEATIR